MLTLSPEEAVFYKRLNEIRANPAAYGQSIGLDLSAYPPAAPLAVDDRLMSASRGFAAYLGSPGSEFEHVVNNYPGGSTPNDRLNNAGYPYVLFAEELDAGPQSPDVESALRNLILDPGPTLGHRNELLGAVAQHSDVGFGIAHSGLLQHYYVLELGQRDAPPLVIGQATPGCEIEMFGSAGYFATGRIYNTGDFVVDSYPSGGTHYVIAKLGQYQWISPPTVVGVYNAKAWLTLLNLPPSGTDPFIAWCYANYLHRGFSYDLLTYWRNQLAAGKSTDEVQAEFAGSLEYRTKNPDFLTALYRDVLFRAPDAAGLAYWQQQINHGLSAAAVALAFLQSPERQQLLRT